MPEKQIVQSKKDLNRHFSKDDIQMASTWKDAQHYFIREMQVKTAMRYHLILVIIKKPTNNICWKGCGVKGTLLYCWWGYKLIQPLWKTEWWFLKKTNKQTKLGTKTAYDPAIALLGIYPVETKSEKDTSIPLFIAAVFTIARTWKPPRCPLTDEWRKNLWYIYTMEYYSAIKRNTIDSVLMRLMNLKPIILNELSHREKDKYNILTNIYRISKNGTEEFIYRATMEKQT